MTTRVGTSDGRPAVRRIRSVAAIVFDERGRLLLVQRGHPPGQGTWSVPGGKVEPGESDSQALAREVAEETGLTVRVGTLVGTVQRAGGSGTIYDIYDYDATIVHDEIRGLAPADARAADDAADLRWVTRPEMATLPLTEGLFEALHAWGRLPGPPPARPEDPVIHP